MLKIKGLKKKKKGKKSKRKEEELFEAAELEEYRREQQKKQEELKEKGLENHENDEEWQKFKLLTSGVDDILKKTQGDLDRIKSTSFFQKKSPAPTEPSGETEKKPDRPERPREPTEKRWVGFEEGDSSLTVEVTEDTPEVSVQETGEQEFKTEAFTEEEEEESEEEDDLDDIFDTSYVDAVESGEVVLAYIPESPTQEDDTGYDPFDTSIVDKVISVKDQKKALVTLGSAVEVLSGKVDKPASNQEASPFKSSKRRRPRPQDLLLGSFDEVQPSVSPVQVAVEPAPKSILDDDPFFEERTSETLGFVPVTPVGEVTTPSIVPQPQKKDPLIDIKNLVDEFVSPVTPSADLRSLQLTEPVKEVDEFEDEFAALAAESLSKEKEATKPKPPPPRPAPPAANKAATTDSNDPDDDDDLEDDPFDTTFADKVLPGKYELKIIEKEVLHDHVQEDTTNIVQNKIDEVLKNSDLTINLPTKKFKETFEDDDDFKLLSPSQRDLLGGSTTDLSSIGQNPIRPEAVSSSKEDTVHYSDPFDTSVIDSLVAPKKTELKYLEQELLVDSNKVVNETDADDDFDPRAGETKIPSRPDSLVVDPSKRVSVPKIVAFDVTNESEQDLLAAVDQDEASKIGKPLTPYYSDKNIIEEKLTCESEVDPFDTSYVNNAPGKVELKLLENELVGKDTPQVDLSDQDFDPRSNDRLASITADNAPNDIRQDIISEDVRTDIKLHTPVIPRKIEEDLKSLQELDPFDTSIVNNLAPSKAEIKFLEKELIESGTVPIRSSDNSSEVVKNLLEKAKKQSVSSDTDLLAQIHDDDSAKPLTPIPADFSIEDDDYDPFDTSAVENILPGKTEIKLLESELLN